MSEHASASSVPFLGDISAREARDLVAAWLALGVAFTFFFERLTPATLPGYVASEAFVPDLVVSLATVGLAFVLHELAHKVVAVRFGQVAEFRADYSMLAVAIALGLAGFIFAAPGAVHHRGYLTDREHGLIALAGPVTNLALAAAFLPVVAVAPTIGWRGVGINLLLAGFNMLPFGPLDGRTVLSWSALAFAAVFVPSVAFAGAAVVLGIGF